MTLDRDLAETALGKIQAEVGLAYAAVDQDGVDGLTLIEPGYVMPHPTLPAVRVHHRDDLWTKPISKVLLRHPSLSDDELASAARGVVGSLATVTMSGPVVRTPAMRRDQGDRLGARRRPPRAHSRCHHRLRRHAQRHPHVRLGRPGSAMANAHPELKAVADEVMLSEMEDHGIAAALERLFPCRSDPGSPGARWVPAALRVSPTSSA